MTTETRARLRPVQVAGLLTVAALTVPFAVSAFYVGYLGQGQLMAGAVVALFGVVCVAPGLSWWGYPGAARTDIVSGVVSAFVFTYTYGFLVTPQLD